MSSFQMLKQQSSLYLEMDRQYQSNETTPSDISDDILALCSDLTGGRPQYIPVINDQYGLYRWCVDGVKEKISNDGGELVFGWTIWEWPNVLVNAGYHAIWKDSDQKLFDITPKPQDEKEILFLLDESKDQDFDFDQRPRSVLQKIYKTPYTDDFYQQKIKGMKASQLAYEEKRARQSGLSIIDWLKRKQPSDDLEHSIDSYLSITNELFDRLETIPANAPLTRDKKNEELSAKQIRLVEKIKHLSSK